VSPFHSIRCMGGGGRLAGPYAGCACRFGLPGMLETQEGLMVGEERPAGKQGVSGRSQPGAQLEVRTREFCVSLAQLGTPDHSGACEGPADSMQPRVWGPAGPRARASAASVLSAGRPRACSAAAEARGSRAAQTTTTTAPSWRRSSTSSRRSSTGARPGPAPNAVLSRMRAGPAACQRVCRTLANRCAARGMAQRRSFALLAGRLHSASDCLTAV